MSRWSSARKRWMNSPATTKKIPFLYALAVINLGPADSTFLANVAHSAEQWQLNVEKLDAQGDYGPLAGNTRPGQLHRLIRN